MSQLILQPFRCFTYVSYFSNPSFASPTSQALHLIHLASRPWLLWCQSISRVGWSSDISHCSSLVKCSSGKNIQQDEHHEVWTTKPDENLLVNAILKIRAGLGCVNKCCKGYKLPSDVLRKIGTLSSYTNDIWEDSDQIPSTSQSYYILDLDIQSKGRCRWSRGPAVLSECFVEIILFHISSLLIACTL